MSSSKNTIALGDYVSVFNESPYCHYVVVAIVDNSAKNDNDGYFCVCFNRRGEDRDVCYTGASNLTLHPHHKRRTDIDFSKWSRDAPQCLPISGCVSK